MKKIMKTFLHRGLMFGGFGPIILGIIYACIDRTQNLALSGIQVLVAIVSVYILAFIQAGASVFNQIEEWSTPKSTLVHFSLLYLAYVFCYLINSWIPFNVSVLIFFTAIFIIVYFVVWITVVISLKRVSGKLNSKIK